MERGSNGLFNLTNSRHSLMFKKAEGYTEEGFEFELLFIDNVHLALLLHFHFLGVNISNVI